MTNDQQPDISEDNSIGQFETEKGDQTDTAHTTMSIYHPRTLLSSWLQPDAAETDSAKIGQGKIVAGHRRVMLMRQNSKVLLNSEERFTNGGRVWNPDIGSLNPNMVDRFTDNLLDRTERFRSIGVNPRQGESSQTDSAPRTELILPGEISTGSPDNGETAVAEYKQQGLNVSLARKMLSGQKSIFDSRSHSKADSPSKSTSPGQPRPARRPARPVRPVVPPNARPIARIQEVAPGEAKTKAPSPIINPIPKAADLPDPAEAPELPPEDSRPKLRARPRPPRAVFLQQPYLETGTRAETTEDERLSSEESRLASPELLEAETDEFPLAQLDSEIGPSPLSTTRSGSEDIIESSDLPLADRDFDSAQSLSPQRQTDAETAEVEGSPRRQRAESPSPVQPQKDEETATISGKADTGPSVRRTEDTERPVAVQPPVEDETLPPAAFLANRPLVETVEETKNSGSITKRAAEAEMPVRELSLVDDKSMPEGEADKPHLDQEKPDDMAQPASTRRLEESRMLEATPAADRLPGAIEMAQGSDPVVEADDAGLTAQRMPEAEMPVRELSSADGGLMPEEEADKPSWGEEKESRDIVQPDRSQRSMEREMPPRAVPLADVAPEIDKEAEGSHPVAKPDDTSLRTHQASERKLPVQELPLRDESPVQEKSADRLPLDQDRPADIDQPESMQGTTGKMPAQQTLSPADNMPVLGEEADIRHRVVKSDEIEPTSQRKTEPEMPLWGASSAEILSLSDVEAEESSAMAKPDDKNWPEAEVVQQIVDDGPSLQKPLTMDEITISNEERERRRAAQPDNIEATGQPEAEPDLPVRELPIAERASIPETGAEMSSSVLKAEDADRPGMAQQVTEGETTARDRLSLTKSIAPSEPESEGVGPTIKPDDEIGQSEPGYRAARDELPLREFTLPGGPARSAPEAEGVHPPTQLDYVGEPTGMRDHHAAESSTPLQEHPTAPKLSGTEQLGQDILARAALHQQITLLNPSLMGQFQTKPAQPVVQKQAPAPKAAHLTPQTARSYLETRGWRFKTSAGSESSGDPRLIARTVTDLERSADPGKPLQSKPRSVMETVIQRDLGDVRIHRTRLAPLQVQAATRESDVYLDSNQDDEFETAESMALLGHELTHVSQQKKMAQTKSEILPGIQRDVEADETEADTTERTVLQYMRSTSPSPARKAEQPRRSRSIVQRAPDDDSSLGFEMPDFTNLIPGETDEDEEAATDLETVQATVDEIINERVQELLGALGIDADEGEGAEAGDTARETEDETDLDDLAKKVFPYIKRLIAIERERRIGW